MNIKPNLVAGLAVMLALLLSACGGSREAPVTGKKAELTFLSYLAAGLPEQDVFVEVTPGSDQVRRVTRGEIDMFLDAPVYASRQLAPRDPFLLRERQVGPYPKGEELGFTMRQWLAGTGKGTYTIAGPEAEIDLRFEHLVPGALYTVWCAPISMRPDLRGATDPCGLPDGSENIFFTDYQGNGRFYLALNPLPDTTFDTAWMVMVVYHGNGRAYGPFPGDLGQNSHAQLLALIPPPQDNTWQVETGASRSIARQ